VSADESFDAYRARVLGYLGSRDPLRVQATTPRRLEQLVAGVSSRALTRRPAPGKWCAAEIVAHMADAELAMGWRLRSMLAAPGVGLAWSDEHRWSEVCRYQRIPVARSLTLFRALRAANLMLVRALPRRRLNACYGVHDRRGRQTMWDFVVMEAAHDLNHLRQIEALLGRPR
jgi:DinB family protein